jgi:hypothetical protein
MQGRTRRIPKVGLRYELEHKGVSLLTLIFRSRHFLQPIEGRPRYTMLWVGQGKVGASMSDEQ